MNCTAFTYYVTLCNVQVSKVCVLDYISVKINKHVAIVHQFKPARMVSVILRLICVFLGCDMSIQLVLSSEYDEEYDDWKIVSSCTDSRHGIATYVTFYA